MQNEKHTILGATGSVGKAVIRELQSRNLPVRAVSRSVDIEGVEVVRADLLNAAETEKAVAGSAYVYLTVGLEYSSKVWQRDWLPLMENVISACAKHDAVLIFLDNVYMYGPPPLAVPFDETHPQQPVTKKGKVRKKLADTLLQAFREEKIKGLIGRSADFYGPHANLSPFYFSFLERMLQGKGPQSLASPNAKHTYANVDDNGRALVALALDPATYGQVWHLPVGRPITVNEMAAIFNKELGASFTVSFLPAFLRKIIGWFNPTLRELEEMMYQFEEDYIMSFEKFRDHFPDFKVSTYEEGVKEMIASFK